MKVIVKPHKIELIKEESVNEKEINISKCKFEFDERITEEYTKEAYFTLNDKTYKKIIVNNECDFPSEILSQEGIVELGVVAFLVEDNEEITRFNPTPVRFHTMLGSLKENAENSEETIINNIVSLKNNYNEAFLDIESNLLTDTIISLCVDNNIPVEVWTVDFAGEVAALNPIVSGVASNRVLSDEFMYNKAMSNYEFKF